MVACANDWYSLAQPIKLTNSKLRLGQRIGTAFLYNMSYARIIVIKNELFLVIRIIIKYIDGCIYIRIV